MAPATTDGPLLAGAVRRQWWRWWWCRHVGVGAAVGVPGSVEVGAGPLGAGGSVIDPLAEALGTRGGVGRRVGVGFGVALADRVGRVVVVGRMIRVGRTVAVGVAGRVVCGGANVGSVGVPPGYGGRVNENEGDGVGAYVGLYVGR